MEKHGGKGLQQEFLELEGSQCMIEPENTGCLVTKNGWEPTLWGQPDLNAVEQPSSGFQHRKTGSLIRQIVAGTATQTGFESYPQDTEFRVLKTYVLLAFARKK